MHAAEPFSRTSKSPEKSSRDHDRRAGAFYKVCTLRTENLTSSSKLASGELAKLSSDRQPEVIRAFLLQPHVTRMIVGQFDDQHALVFGQR